MISNKFDYSPLVREHTGTGRVYRAGGEQLPSITTILSKTKPAADVAALEAWRQREPEHKAILSHSLSTGTSMHQNLENHLLSQSKPEGTLQVKLMSEVMIKKGLVQITELYGCEVPLYYPGLYAGTADCIAKVHGVETTIDFKNSRRPKKLEYIGDYRLQAAAYALAHNVLYKTNIAQTLIMVVTQDYEYQEFLTTGEDFHSDCEEWWNRVRQFYDLLPTPADK